MKTFVSKSGSVPPPAVQTKTGEQPEFVSTRTPVPEFEGGPTGNVTTTDARPNPSWTKRELIAYAEAHNIAYPADGCKSEIYAAVTGSLEESYGDTC